MTSVSNDSDTTIYTFDRFQLEAARRLLRTDTGETIPLVSKAFDTLLYFVMNPGRVIGKDELMSSIWPDTVVEENNLNKNVSILRRVLGDDRRDHRYIVTVPGQGYKFVADVQTLETAAASSTQEAPSVVPKRSYKPVLAIVVFAGLLIVGLAGFFWTRRDGVQPANATPTIAVLPFRPLVAEHGDEAIELGMAEALISRLSENRGLIVRPLSSVRGFNSLDQDALSAGHALTVDFIVDGSIQRWGDKIRVTVRLVSVSDGGVLWNEAFDEAFTDIFTVQDTISNRTMAAISPHLNSDDRSRSRYSQTQNPDAYAFYLRGRYFAYRVTEADMRKAIDFYKLATQADPNYALAYAGMADAYRTLAIAGYAAPNEACPKASALAEQALTLDNSLAEAHIVMGWIAFLYEWDRPKAEKELLKAIELSPNESEARRAYAHFLSNSGRHSEAIREGRIARELAPLTLITAILEAQFLFYGGHDEEALDRTNHTLELDPDFWVTHTVIGRIYLKQKRFPEAIEELQRASELSQGSPEPLAQLGYAYAISNDTENALKVVDRLEQLSKERFVPEYSFALIYNGLGETERSLYYLQRSYAARETPLAFIGIDTRWDNIRTEPRFVEVATGIGIPRP